METIYFAGGCLWGVQAFMQTLPGVITTEAGRANGTTNTINGDYDGYAECVKTEFDPALVSVTQLMAYFFEIIDPCSLNQQGEDVGVKYRTGVYSQNNHHLALARDYIRSQANYTQIVVEVCPLTNYVTSAPEHQDRLTRHPEDYRYCYIPQQLLTKYK